MQFNDMCQIAKNIAAQYIKNNKNNNSLSMNDTICVVYTCSGKINVGISSSKMINNIPLLVHAEIEVCNILSNQNDTAIAEMSLFNAVNFQPVLPCNDCALKIMSLNSYNLNTLLVLPTEKITLQNMNTYIQNQNRNTVRYPEPTQSMSLESLQGSSPVRSKNTSPSIYASSSYLAEHDNDDSQLLRGRLNSLLSDDEDVEELKNKKAKEKASRKKKFNFFKGKGKSDD